MSRQTFAHIRVFSKEERENNLVFSGQYVRHQMCATANALRSNQF
jgi:hypothetical protein